MNKSLSIIKTLEDLIDTPKSTHINDFHYTLADEAERSKAFNSNVGDKLDAIKHYNASSLSINDHLRHGKDLPDEHKGHLENLRSVTNVPTKHDFHAFRGSTGVDYSNLKEGSIIHDKGFTSTSLSPNHANSFGHRSLSPKPHKHLFRIHITPGTKGHYISAHDDEAELENQNESEFALHSGTRFKVAGHHQIKLGNNHYHITDLHIHSQED